MDAERIDGTRNSSPLGWTLAFEYCLRTRYVRRRAVAESGSRLVQKADLRPADDAAPDQIALDETVIRINGQQYRLYAAIDPDTNRFLHIRLFSTTTTALTQRFLRELREKHDVSDAVFLVDYATHLEAALQRAGLRFQTVRRGNRNAVERLF